jgi:hypothetical protein
MTMRTELLRFNGGVERDPAIDARINGACQGNQRNQGIRRNLFVPSPPVQEVIVVLCKQLDDLIPDLFVLWQFELSFGDETMQLLKLDNTIGGDSF